jgi:hypothetical protein
MRHQAKLQFTDTLIFAGIALGSCLLMAGLMTDGNHMLVIPALVVLFPSLMAGLR